MSNVQTQSQVPSAREEIAAAVRAHFAVRNLSDAKAARMVGKSQSWMSRRTNGDTPIDADELGLIAGSLGISYVDLVQMPKFFPTAPRTGDIATLDTSRNAQGVSSVNDFAPTDGELIRVDFTRSKTA